MLNIFIIIGIVLVVLIGGIVGYAATRPDSFQVTRSINIEAPPEKIFPLINDFHNFILWSPFERDPEMKRIFSGPQTGAGAVYEYDGNSQVGAGRVSIMEAVEPESVVMKLDFFRPMQAQNRVIFTLTPKDGGTEVTWMMDGANPLLAKVMQLFMSMDKMVGGSFETGLVNLKEMAEK